METDICTGMFIASLLTKFKKIGDNVNVQQWAY